MKLRGGETSQQKSSNGQENASQMRAHPGLLPSRPVCQAFGAAGLSSDYPLAQFFAWARALRFADGPDEVHRATVAKMELKPYQRDVLQTCSPIPYVVCVVC